MLRKTIHVEEELFIDDHTMHLVDQVAGRNIIAKKAWVVQRPILPEDIRSLIQYMQSYQPMLS
jgi:hypothetical protein